MNKKTIMLVILTTLLIATIIPTITIAQEVPYGPWPDTMTFQAEDEDAKVYDMLENNEVQVHIADISDPDVFLDIKNSPNLEYVISYGLFFDLTFNPYGPTFTNGKLNPFSNPAIREAMNLLVDRNYIAEELLGGLAVAKLSILNAAFPDYGKIADVMMGLEAQYAYNFDRAKTIIFSEMAKMGAVYTDGKWYYNNELVNILMLIRIDNAPRVLIGDYTADQLELLGFTTTRTYKNSRDAGPDWQGDPSRGVFHIYTGGWITEAVDRDQSDDFSFMYTQRGGWGLPLWAAYTPDPLFYEVAAKLDEGDWTTIEERQALMAQAAEMAMKDSVRIWLVDQIVPFPFRKEYEVAGDLASGLFSNAISQRTLRKTGTVGGLIKVSDREVLVDPWNPIVGTNWAYDAHVINALVDGAYIYNPYTGLAMPNTFVSATVDVLMDAKTTSSSSWLTLNKVAAINVPSDAWYDWDYDTKEVIFAPAGTTAGAKVTLNFGNCIGNVKYHDGSVMSRADWIATFPIDYERNNPESPLYDATAPAQFEALRQIFKGWRITSWEPLIMEVYLDYSNLDAELILAQATELTLNENPTWGLNSFWPTMPWHVKAIGILAEEKGLLAFTQDKAEELLVEWMSYIGGPSLGILNDMLTEAKNTNYLPFAELTEDYITAGEITERYTNLQDWYADHGNFWVASGPFYLDSVDFTGHIVTVKAYRDYPYKADRFSYLSEPPIPESSVQVPQSVVPGLASNFNLSLSSKGNVYPNDRIDFVKYVILDSLGAVAAKGDAQAIAAGKWSIALNSTETSKLSAGSYTLKTIALSKDVAVPGVSATPFIVIPELSYFQTLLAQTQAQLNVALSQLQTTTTNLNKDISSLQGAVSSAQTLMYAAIGIAVIAILIAIYAVTSKSKRYIPQKK